MRDRLIVKKVIARLVSEESGLETVEYAILTGLIVAGVIGALAAVGAWVLTQYTDAQAALGAL